MSTPAEVKSWAGSLQDFSKLLWLSERGFFCGCFFYTYTSETFTFYHAYVLYLMLCYISASPKGNIFPGETMYFRDLRIKKKRYQKSKLFFTWKWWKYIRLSSATSVFAQVLRDSTYRPQSSTRFYQNFSKIWIQKGFSPHPSLPKIYREFCYKNLLIIYQEHSKFAIP